MAVDLGFRMHAERTPNPNSIKWVLGRPLVEGGISRLPMEKTPAGDALYREYAACQRAAGLGDGENPLVGGGSDANTVGGVGLAAIDGLGPRGAGFHTPGEYVELDSFAPKAEALARFLWGRLK